MASYRSDHSIVEINIQISKFKRGKDLWKLNCNLLNNAAYIEQIYKTIHKVKLEYALPIVGIEYLETAPYLDIKFSIDEDLPLEMIMFKIRSTTIKYGSTIKKEEIKIEQGLTQKSVILKRMKKILSQQKLLTNLKKIIKFKGLKNERSHDKFKSTMHTSRCKLKILILRAFIYTTKRETFSGIMTVSHKLHS